MSTPTLYSFRRCPYAMRARMALRYSGVSVNIVEVSLKAKPAEMLALSSKGTVPVLNVNGRVIEESLEIMRWALEYHDPQDWRLKDDLGYNKALSTLGIVGYGFAPLRLPADLDFVPMFHGIDERVPVDALQFGVRVLQRFIATC